VCLARSQSFRTRRENGGQHLARQAVRRPVDDDRIDIELKPERQHGAIRR
jgi:hypothetical protein